MTTREHILWRIAELYTDLTDPTGGPSDIRGPGESDGGMNPKLYTPTVKEYERLVKLMRDDRHEPLIRTNGERLSIRSLWWHLEHFHHRAVRVTRHYPVTAKAGGKIVQLHHQDGSLVTRPAISHLRDPKANEQKAQLAIEWIAQHWNLQSEPMIPEPVRSWKGSQVAA
jgi:hypothetical protein